jgi:hypothetical protein
MIDVALAALRPRGGSDELTGRRHLAGGAVPDLSGPIASVVGTRDTRPGEDDGRDGVTQRRLGAEIRGPSRAAKNL